jgi:hypothetical protein
MRAMARGQALVTALGPEINDAQQHNPLPMYIDQSSSALHRKDEAAFFHTAHPYILSRQTHEHISDTRRNTAVKKIPGTQETKLFPGVAEHIAGIIITFDKMSLSGQYKKSPRRQTKKLSEAFLDYRLVYR